MLRSDGWLDSGGGRITAPGAIAKGLEHLGRTQHADGSWHGDYGGPLFLLPLYIATCHIAGIAIAPPAQREMRKYLQTHQNEDGGFGLNDTAGRCSPRRGASTSSPF